MRGFPAGRVGLFSILLYLITAVSPVKFADSKGVVCLLDSTDIHIRKNLTATVRIHRSFEITSEAGTRYAQVIIPINEFVEVEDIAGFTKLPNGTKIKLTKQDIGTTSSPGIGGFGGVQATVFSLRTPIVGSLVYYEYKLKIKSLLYLPRISRRTDYAINRLAVNLRWDKKVEIRYDAQGVSQIPRDRSILFRAENLAEIPDEPLSCPDGMHISISLDRFSYDRVKYSSRNWQEVGSFFQRLSAQPPGAEEMLKSLSSRLAQDSRTRLDTLLAFYNFLADSVAYIALQMGKGDFTPHSCEVILNRRFGDCKDQSVLLSSLCRAAGFDAYPALIYTGDYPEVDKLWSWPAWFDHVITVVRGKDGDLLLDPSDPLASVGSLPPRLRGKSYLVCDGKSGLQRTPDGPIPAFGILWQFRLLKSIDGQIEVAFSIKYANDAAGIYRDYWARMASDEINASIQTQLRYSGWRLSNLEIDDVRNTDDSLIVDGKFRIDMAIIGDSRSLAIASPLNSQLLDNLFPDIRKNDYCKKGSLRLEEYIMVDHAIPGLQFGPEFSDSWQRPAISFRDEMAVGERNAIYHRLFTFDGGVLAAPDYNAFRDFLLSRKDQQYVRFQK